MMYSDAPSHKSHIVDFYSQIPKTRCNLPTGRMALCFGTSSDLYNIYLDNNYLGAVTLNEAMEWVACKSIPARTEFMYTKAANHMYPAKDK